MVEFLREPIRRRAVTSFRDEQGEISFQRGDSLIVEAATLSCSPCRQVRAVCRHRAATV